MTRELDTETQAVTRAVAGADRFVESVVDRGAVFTGLAFDPGFGQTCTLREARTEIRARYGVDIGYDLGDDLSTAVYGLPLLGADQTVLAEHLTALLDRGLIGRRYRFFLTRNGFPADTDCTSVATQALWERGLITDVRYAELAGELLDAAVPPRDVVIVYWDDDVETGTRSRGRKYDAVVCANALVVLKGARAAGLLGREADRAIVATHQYVAEHLTSGSYRDGTRYYPYEDAFLHSVARLTHRHEDSAAVLTGPLTDAIRKRETDSGPDRDLPLNVALRMIAARDAGLTDGQAERRRTLLAGQAADGGWPASPYYTLGRLPAYFGSRLLTTLFAVNALREDRR